MNLIVTAVSLDPTIVEKGAGGGNEAQDWSCPDAKGFKCHGKEFGLSSSVIRKLVSPCTVFLLECLLLVLPHSAEATRNPRSSMV